MYYDRVIGIHEPLVLLSDRNRTVSSADPDDNSSTVASMFSDSEPDVPITSVTQNYTGLYAAAVATVFTVLLGVLVVLITIVLVVKIR